MSFAGLLLDETSHVLVGVVAALVGVFAHRAWSRRRWHRAPVGVVVEAVLVVDLVDSTWLATRQVGVCRLKGFGGFHRVYELRWSEL